MYMYAHVEVITSYSYWVNPVKLWFSLSITCSPPAQAQCSLTLHTSRGTSPSRQPEAVAWECSPASVWPAHQPPTTRSRSQAQRRVLAGQYTLSLNNKVAHCLMLAVAWFEHNVQYTMLPTPL